CGYTSPGYSLWLEVNNAVAPFLSILIHIIFRPFNSPNIHSFPTRRSSDLSGATPGNMSESGDMGDTTSPLTFQPPGTYHAVDITVMLGTPLISSNVETFYVASSSQSPKISEVSDSDFNNNAIPRATFTFTV